MICSKPWSRYVFKNTFDKEYVIEYVIEYGVYIIFIYINERPDY